MNNYENSKKARRVASVIYLLIMAVILGGTYLSNQQKEMAERVIEGVISKSMETPGGFSEYPSSSDIKRALKIRLSAHAPIDFVRQFVEPSLRITLYRFVQ